MKCIGCGVKLQTIDPETAGYVHEIHMIENGEQVYCKRCYDILHYNKKYCVLEESDFFYEKMKQVYQKDKKAIVLLILDVLDIYGGFTPKLVKLIEKFPVILLINKVDILPKDLRLSSTEKVTRMMGETFGLNVIGVYPISAKSKRNIEAVIGKIDKLRYPYRYSKKATFDHCYVVGCASVGKSTFINSVKELASGENNTPITTSDQFQTTLDFIKVDLGNHFSLIDTPGIVNTRSFHAYLDYESVKILTPKRYLKVRTYQLRSQQTLFLGGLVRLDFEQGEKMSVSCYVSNELYIHRTKSENADELNKRQSLRLLVPPLTEKEKENLGENEVTYFNIEDSNSCYDLIFPGIGFLHIKGEGIQLSIHMSKKVSYQLVKSNL